MKCDYKTKRMTGEDEAVDWCEMEDIICPHEYGEECFCGEEYMYEEEERR